MPNRAVAEGRGAGTGVDPGLLVFAERARDMVTSEVRALFAVAARPEVVSLAGGMPDTAALPLADIAERTAALLLREGASALQYGSGQGDPALREAIGELTAEVGLSTTADDVVVTTGSQQALDLVAKVLCDPGDVVLVESPSYVGALSAFGAYQADVRHVTTDADGMVPEALADALAAVAAEGRRVPFVYVVPNHGNPSGATLAEARRDAVVAACRTGGTLLVEDDPYGLLGFAGPPLRSLADRDRDAVVHLGSFSKTFAAGLRVGYAVAPPPLRAKLVLAQESAVLCPSAFTQAVVRDHLQHGGWQELVKSLREHYRTKCEAMVTALRRHLPEARFVVPHGGFFVWAQMPEGVDTTAMLPRAVGARVAYVPGTAFFADTQGHGHARLSFCFPTAERIEEGVRRLAGVVAAEVEVRATFGPAAGQERVPGRTGPTPDQS